MDKIHNRNLLVHFICTILLICIFFSLSFYTVIVFVNGTGLFDWSATLMWGTVYLIPAIYFTIEQYKLIMNGGVIPALPDLRESDLDYTYVMPAKYMIHLITIVLVLISLFAHYH